jgi:DUF1009 family protein
VTDRAAGPLVILAGSGDLPGLVAARLAQEGREHRILALRGFADRAVRRRADATLDLLDVAGTLACLDGWGATVVTLVGGVRRPSPSAALGAFAAVRNRAEVATLMARGDDNLLRGVASLLEERGHRLVGIQEVAPGLLARAGPYGARQPDASELAAIGLGLRLLADLSPYDIGQAVVVEGERILAVEGPEGTDRMIARVGGSRLRQLFRPAAPAGILVKAAKLGQDSRIDLPTIGPRTLRNAARAGLRGLAVTSGNTLVLHPAASAAAADRLGLFLVGIEPDGAGARA